MIFDGLQAMARRTTPPDPEDAPNRVFMTRLPTAGIHVNENTALGIAAVWECVRIISETVAMLPWRLMERTGTGQSARRQVLDGEALDFLINKRPNDELPALYFKEALQAHALLWPGGYAEIERARGNREPVALHLLMPDTVTPKRTEQGSLFFEVRDPKGAIVVNQLAPEDVFHIRGPSWDGHAGYSLVRLARETLSTALATEQFTAAFFGNGASLGGIISAPEGMSQDEEVVKNLLATFNAKHRGARRAHKVEFLDAGLTFKEVGSNPEEAQLIEAKKFNVLDVARWFRMPPHKLAHLDTAIKANIEHQGIEFVTDTMLPWVLRWEQEGDFKFFDPSDRGERFTKMDLKALLRGDSVARGNFYKVMASIGALNINEVRELEDMDSIGPAGDLRLVPMNMVSIEEAARTGNTGVTRTRSTDAFRQLFEDAVARATEHECKTLEGKVKTAPEHFQQWATGYYESFALRLEESLLNPTKAMYSALSSDEANGNVLALVRSFVASERDQRCSSAIRAAEQGSLKALVESRRAGVKAVAEDLTERLAVVISMVKEPDDESVAA